MPRGQPMFHWDDQFSSLALSLRRQFDRRRGAQETSQVYLAKDSAGLPSLLPGVYRVSFEDEAKNRPS